MYTRLYKMEVLRTRLLITAQVDTIAPESGTKRVASWLGLLTKLVRMGPLCSIVCEFVIVENVEKVCFLWCWQVAQLFWLLGDASGKVWPMMALLPTSMAVIQRGPCCMARTEMFSKLKIYLILFTYALYNMCVVYTCNIFAYLLTREWH